MNAPSMPQHFFIIGAMKAGTTSLFKYLAGHPELYASPRKEPRTFRDERDPARLRADFEALFEGRQAEPWCFEASTAYTKFPRIGGVPERIRRLVPGARFVYVVRNPLDRAWSHYVHNVAHGRESRHFADVVRSRPEYLDISRYHLQLSEYRAHFDDDRILVQVFEEMVRDPAAAVREVCTFLGVDASYCPPTADVTYNASSDKRAAPRPIRMAQTLGVEAMLPWRLRRWMTDRGAELPAKSTMLTQEIRTRIVEVLRPDTEQLFTWMGRRVAAWAPFN